MASLIYICTHFFFALDDFEAKIIINYIVVTLLAAFFLDLPPPLMFLQDFLNIAALRTFNSHERLFRFCPE